MVLLSHSKEQRVRRLETLPGNAGGLLDRLRIKQLFDVGNYAKYSGNLVCWGSAALYDREFINEQDGQGWYIDRDHFDEALRRLARERGVTMQDQVRLLHAEETTEGICISYKTDADRVVTIEADFLIDATGRNALVSRSLGGKRTTLDALTCFSTNVTPAVVLPEGRSLTESHRDGWWFAVPVDGGSYHIQFMTDPDLHRPLSEDLPQWFWRQLSLTKYCARHFMGGSLTSGISVRTCTTGFAAEPTGKYWAAAGDAAFSFDPLCSYGITTALGTGYYAALTADELMNGNEDALNGYKLILTRTFDSCARLLRVQYEEEMRWGDAPFWQRRQKKI